MRDEGIPGVKCDLGMPFFAGLRKETFTVKKKYLTASTFSCIVPMVMGMENIVEQTLLYDFYGELLTEHQRQIYEDVVFNDFSLSEVAEERGISRQGVHDMIRRCGRQLAEYEDKLHLVEKFLNTRAKVEQIYELAHSCCETKDPDLAAEIERIAQDIIREL